MGKFFNTSSPVTTNWGTTMGTVGAELRVRLKIFNAVFARREEMHTEGKFAGSKTEFLKQPS